MVESLLTDEEIQAQAGHDTLDQGTGRAGLVWIGTVLLSLVGAWCMSAYSAERPGSAKPSQNCKLLARNSDTGWRPKAGEDCATACAAALASLREVKAPQLPVAPKTSDAVTYTCRNDQSVTVSYQPNPPANRPPTISGTPPDSIPVGGEFYFLPRATDPDGDAISYSCASCPSWVTFRPTDGRMTGIPQEAGVWSAVTVTARDARGATAALAPFTVTVTALPTPQGTARLTWQHDGRSVTGFLVNYGTTSTARTSALRITNPAARSAEVTGLAAGTWHFSVSADNSGTLSAPSNVQSKAIR